MANHDLTAYEIVARYEAGERDFHGYGIRGADLYCADLSGADLRECVFNGADLSDVDFTGANLAGADFTRADLSYAILCGANLESAHLFCANLTNASLLEALNPPLSSHEFIAEVLRQHIEDNLERRAVAGLVLVSRDWCWKQFGEIAREQWSAETRTWIVDTLGHWPKIRACLLRYGFIDREK